MYRHKRRSIINLTLLSCICIISVTLSACTSGGVSAGADSPVLETCRLQGQCSGGENDQSITAALTFDRAVAFDEGLADQLRIVIGGQRIDSEDISIGQNGEDGIEITVPVVQVNDGMMEISNAPDSKELTALTDKEGKNCVGSLNIEQLIPSGAEISSVEQGPGRAVYKVDSVVTHRSIIWLRLIRDGETVVPDDTDTTDVMENAAAVHEHEFLWATPESTAADMAETLNAFFSSGFEAFAEGNRLTVTEKNGGQSSLQLEIYAG